MPKTNGVLLVAVILLGLLSFSLTQPGIAASQVIHHVSTTGSDVLPGDGSELFPFATIQHAIDQCLDGDEVWVQPGTYTGDGNRDIDFLGKAVIVKSVDEDPATVTIDCQGSELDPHRGFIFQEDEGPGSVLIGFTITNGWVAGNDGGGILLEGSDPSQPPYNVNDGSSPTLSFCDIVYNVGGGLEIQGTLAYPDISNCKFNHNQGDGIRAHYAATRVVDSEISHNSAYGANLYAFEGTRCDIVGNVSGGINSYWESDVALYDCLIDGNQGNGLTVGGTEGDSILIRDSVISNNLGAGVDSQYQWYEFAAYNSEFSGNGEQGLQLGIPKWYNCTLDSCSILDNGSNGLELSPMGFKTLKDPAAEAFTLINISNCEIGRNQGAGIQGDLEALNPSFISQTIIFDNTGDGINLTLDPAYNYQAGMDVPSYLQLEYVTISGNDGRGIFADVDSLALGNVLIADNGLEALVSVDVGYIEVGCSDIFNNALGDWTGLLAGLAGLYGNLEVDPVFCGPESNPDDPYALYETSPCAMENNGGCGGIGARGIGCHEIPVIEPVILSVEDVGGDQGGQVRLVWEQCDHDTSGSEIVVTGYGVYRQQDGFKSSTPDLAGGDKLLGWDFLTTVPARQDEFYQYVAPTLCDSTISNGLCTSTFMVSAMTADPGVYFDSAPLTGYSLDNLDPGAPGNLAVDYASEQNTLTWSDPVDPDFSHFCIYRTLKSQGPPPLDAEPLEIVQVAAWIDLLAGIAGDSWDFNYWLAAVDKSGNRSPVVGHGSISAVGIPGSRARTALVGNAPNPFNPRTAIAFELAASGTVDLVVFDVSGREVCALLRGQAYPAGRHEVFWNGMDDTGRQAAAGLYFYRFAAGNFTQTNRMTLLK